MNKGKKFRFYTYHCSYLKILEKIYQKIVHSILKYACKIKLQKEPLRRSVDPHNKYSFKRSVMGNVSWAKFDFSISNSALRSKALHIPGYNIETGICHYRMSLLRKTLRREQNSTEV